MRTLTKLRSSAVCCFLALSLAACVHAKGGGGGGGHGGGGHGAGHTHGGGHDVSVGGYIRANGTAVQGHMRSAPDSTPANNWSTKGNINPYTGKIGTKVFQSNGGYGGSNPEQSLPGSSDSSAPSPTARKNTNPEPAVAPAPVVQSVFRKVNFSGKLLEPEFDIHRRFLAGAWGDAISEAESKTNIDKETRRALNSAIEHFKDALRRHGPSMSITELVEANRQLAELSKNSIALTIGPVVVLGDK